MIIRSNKEKWTTVDNVWVKDLTLSAKAKGILLYILSLPDDWDLHVTELVTHFTDGKDGIRSGMKELMEHGYLYCIPLNDETGKFKGNDYVIMEDPHAELPHTENPDTVNPPLLSTKEKPITNKTLIASDEIKEIIAHLNKAVNLTGNHKFRDTNQQCIKLLNARLKEYTKEDVLGVIDLMANKWIGTEWQMYLRPTTLFNVNKFASYVTRIDVKSSETREATPLQILE